MYMYSKKCTAKNAITLYVFCILYMVKYCDIL